MRYVYKFKAMSTVCELVIFENDKSRADLAAHNVLKTTMELEKKYNYYSPDSYLSKINNREVNTLDNQTKTLLKRASSYYTKTDKTFDITIATLKNLYTTHSSIDRLEKEKELLMPYVGCEYFEIQRDKIKFDNAYTKIDLGGFVKEYSVDMAVKVLQKHKIKSALVNFGGDIFALGVKPNGQKMKIGIKDPHNPSEFYQFVEIEDEALTTSASYERNYTIGEEVYSHIIAKESKTQTPLSVSVISKSCVESGVYSTSLMINPQLKNPHKVITIA